MEIIKLLLLPIIFIGVIGFLISWVEAYYKVINIKNKSQQMAALAPWWFLDNKLLPEEHEHIRIRAIKFLFCI